MTQPSAVQFSSNGGRESLVREFSIEGLYGYRDISLCSEYAATILIARNGTGKTTLIAALDAFLKRQFIRLRDLQFSTIRCQIRGVDGPLILNRSDLEDVYTFAGESEFMKAVARLNVDPKDLLYFLEREYGQAPLSRMDWPENKVLGSIMRSVAYSTKDANAFCESLKQSYYSKSENLSAVNAHLVQALANVDIVYLPTFRRIELPLSDEEDEDVRYKSPARRNQPTIRVSKTGLYHGDIQFGLTDIQFRLHELNNQILHNSNISYRQISADIINELLDGSYEQREIAGEEIPERDELELFFSRLKEGHRVRPYGDVSIPRIDQIYSEKKIEQDANKFLAYFLSKLNTAIKATRDIEVMVEDFVAVCNRYLANDNIWSGEGGETKEERPAPDAKRLVLNRRKLSVSVESLALEGRVPLNSLSSGEKQMISLFSKLYLHPNKKIVLIDEPELSLSLDWQRRILVDAVNAPKCDQVIAITHSPFVFDNELEPFASTVRVVINKQAGQDVVRNEESDSDTDAW